MELKFDEKKHEYRVGKKKLTSVTRFVKQFFEKFDTKKIAKYCAKSRRTKGELNSKGKPINAWDIKKEWIATAQAGTDIHNEIESFINGTNISPLHTKTEQALAFLDDKYGFEFVSAEERIHSEDLGLAGTIDVIIAKPDSKKITLIDWKSNKKLRFSGTRRDINPINLVLPDCNFSHYTLQLSIYAYIMEKAYGLEIDELILVHLMEDSYKEYKIDYRKDLVEVMLEWQKK